MKRKFDLTYAKAFADDTIMKIVFNKGDARDWEGLWI
jgi:hypothetical protein